MKKLAVIYWSGTGNTQEMAIALSEGASAEGAAVNVITVDKATVNDVLSVDAVALGCPSMGSEQLEEMEMEPFVESLEKEALKGKVLALFGSYDWGDGQWMRDWEERMRSAGAILVAEGLIVQNTPDEEGKKECRQLGKKLASV